MTPRDRGADGGAEALVRAYIAALNAGDADAVASHVSDQFVNKQIASIGESTLGRDIYRRRLDRFLAEFGDLHYEIRHIIVEDPQVAVEYIMTGVWHGADDAATSRASPFAIRGMFRFEVDGNRIARRVDFWDGADFERQVGEPST